MPGQSYQPLELYGENCEVDRFRKAACDGDVLDEVIGLLLLDTGMRTGEVCHMNGEWLTTGDENFGVRVPLGDQCRIGAGPRTEKPNTHKRGKVCKACKDQPEKWWAPDDADWRPKTKAAHRFIPIREEDTRQAVQAYFSLSDKLVTHQTVLKRVKNIGTRANIPRKIRPYDLRNTYGTMLADKGFSAHEIKNLMGHASIEPATHYVKLSSRSMQNTFDEKW